MGKGRTRPGSLGTKPKVFRNGTHPPRRYDPIQHSNSSPPPKQSPRRQRRPRKTAPPSPSSDGSPAPTTLTQENSTPEAPLHATSESSQPPTDPPLRHCPRCEWLRTQSTHLQNILVSSIEAQANAVGLWTGAAGFSPGPAVAAAAAAAAAATAGPGFGWHQEGEGMDWRPETAIPVRIVAQPELESYEEGNVHW